MDVELSDGASVRALSRMAHTAAKLSDVAQLAATPIGLQLRALSASQTVHATLQLQSAPPVSPAPSSPSLIVCTRAFLPALRAPATLCSMRLRATDSSTLRVELRARSGVRKSFCVPLRDHVRVRAVSLSSSPPLAVARCAPRLLLHVLHNFHARLDEITLQPAVDALLFSSFVHHDPAHLILRTHMSLPAAELDHYRPPTHSDCAPLTIPCRPLRAALDFCDPFDASVTLSFSCPPNPVVLTMHGEHHQHLPFNARFVFATRHPESPNAAPPHLPAEHHSHHSSTPSHAHNSPSSPYVSASQSNPPHHHHMLSDHVSPPVPHPTAPALTNAPLQHQHQLPHQYDLEQHDHDHDHDQDLHDEYVDATPPP
ncbi:unnamed protein product [Agarophyton chilense]